MTALDPRLSTFDSLLWARMRSSEPPPTLADALLAAAEAGAHEQLTVLTVITEEGVEPLESVAAVASGHGSLYRSVGPLGLLRVPGFGRRTETLALDEGLTRPPMAPEMWRDTAVSSWPTEHDGVFHLVSTTPVTDPRWRRVERWVGSAAPAISSVYLDAADFDDVAVGLSEFGRVEASRLTARSLVDGSSWTRGWRATKDHQRPAFGDVLSEIEGVASVRTVTLHVGERLLVHLRRLAGATYYSGDFGLFETVVLARLARAADRRRNLLSGRERRHKEELPRAIAIRFPNAALAEPAAIADLLDVLASQRALGIAVLHRNPYLHLTIADYLDGSNFDTFVTDESEIVVHPGYRASLGALTRLTQSLGEHFGASEIAEHAELSPPSLEDLVSPL